MKQGLAGEETSAAERIVGVTVHNTVALCSSAAAGMAAAMHPVERAQDLSPTILP